jgi:hypothetical protein
MVEEFAFSFKISKDMVVGGGWAVLACHIDEHDVWVKGLRSVHPLTELIFAIPAICLFIYCRKLTPPQTASPWQPR